MAKKPIPHYIEIFFVNDTARKQFLAQLPPAQKMLFLGKTGELARVSPVLMFTLPPGEVIPTSVENGDLSNMLVTARDIQSNNLVQRIRDRNSYISSKSGKTQPVKRFGIHRSVFVFPTANAAERFMYNLPTEEASSIRKRMHHKEGQRFVVIDGKMTREQEGALYHVMTDSVTYADMATSRSPFSSPAPKKSGVSIPVFLLFSSKTGWHEYYEDPKLTKEEEAFLIDAKKYLRHMDETGSFFSFTPSDEMMEKYKKAPLHIMRVMERLADLRPTRNPQEKRNAYILAFPDQQAAHRFVEIINDDEKNFSNNFISNHLVPDNENDRYITLIGDFPKTKIIALQAAMRRAIRETQEEEAVKTAVKKAKTPIPSPDTPRERAG